MRINRRLAMIVLALGTIGCSGDGPSEPEGISFGTYTLQTINGRRLPYVLLQSGQNSVSLTEDRITISDGGTWSEISVFQSTTNGSPPVAQTGTTSGKWLRSGGSVGLYDATNAPVYTGNFSRNRMDLTHETFALVFTK